METATLITMSPDELRSMMLGVAVEAVRIATKPQESPEDLLNYHEVARIYNMATVSHISRRVSEENIQQHKKDGKVCITRQDAEKLFRKSL